MQENTTPENKMTRRAFGLLLPSAALLPQFGQGQISTANERDGDAWKGANQSVKFGYVLGFTDAAAWAYGNVDGAVSLLKSLSPKDRKMLADGKSVWDYGEIKYKQLIDGMDTFYGDYRNAAIKWDRALSYVRDTIHGEPQDYLDRELEFERKLALLNTEKK
jgi:hypothetical protein